MDELSAPERGGESCLDTCTYRLRVQGLFGPPSGGAASSLFIGRIIAIPARLPTADPTG